MIGPEIDLVMTNYQSHLSLSPVAESCLLVQQLEDVRTGSRPERNDDLSLVLALSNVPIARGHEYLSLSAGSLQGRAPPLLQNWRSHLQARLVAPAALWLYEE